MFLSKSYTPSKSLQFLWLSKLSCSMLLILMGLSIPGFTQEGKDELPAPFFGNWVEDLSECEMGSYVSIADSEIGLLVFGLGWSSTEVRVKEMEGYYLLYVDAVSEGGDFQSEIKIRMGDNGNLFFIDSDSEEKELVKCAPFGDEEGLEFENVEITEAALGLELEELEGSTLIDFGSLDAELPAYFLGEWVEDYAQCEVAANLSIIESVEGLVVSSLDWYSSEVKVENKGDIYTLSIKGSSEEGDFETEINLQMGEDGGLVYSFPDSEAISLVKCNLDGDLGLLEGEFVVVEMEDLMVVDPLVAIEEFDFLEVEDSVTISLELLQGKWQSVEDEFSFMVIEGDRMKTYYKRMEDGMEDELIIISDTCMNESDSANGLTEEKNRYLSNPNLDMCWYIEFVDDTRLSLIYMATGNTLTYRRVE